ncbi:3-oxoacyl-ACP synthase [Polaribacter gangjinensis]|uniref:3-oxoacyl-ACP synthase n=1 Tax=Polaribacter gangjinensis TaxID=574710 RepID=A0A2S7WCY4_9FLAO|nr:3-oxoacyl-ACP synthase [Polaribacter gangjinensis]PQJ75485.1 3-oxoacyl-ACP synthase [Polaribacter gangjinensis]
MNIKEALLMHCKMFVNKRMQTVEEIIYSHQKSLQSETKSSAGDKHETGRAMIQLEMEKASQQLAGISEMNQILSKIDISISENSKQNAAHLGSVVYTAKANYFLSISAGKIDIENASYFAISVSSPIGKLLLGKHENDEFLFDGNRIKIQKIV